VGEWGSERWGGAADLLGRFAAVGYNGGGGFGKMGKIITIAHRGHSTAAPENTLAAFALALDHKPDYIECDVRRTKDGRIIVIHDATVDRTTNGSGKVADLTLAGLRELDAGSKFGSQFAGERLPTLEETLDVMKGKTKPLIELKEEGMEEDVVAAIRERGMVGEVAICSFHYSVGLRLPEIEPDIPFSPIKSVHHPVTEEEAVRLADEAASVNGWVFAFNYPDITPALIRATHAANMLMEAWTIDNDADMRKWIEMGLDAVTSNDIALLNRVLADMDLR